MPSVGNSAHIPQTLAAQSAIEVIRRNRLICLTSSSAAIVLASICMIWSQRFSAIASVPIRVQHAIDIPFANETIQELTWFDRDWYRIGALDCITTAAYMLLVLIAVTSAEELLLMGPVRHVDRPEEAARYSAMLLFHAFTVIHAVAVIARGHFGMTEVWNGYPGTLMPFVSKLFLIWQVAFWAHCMFYDSTFKEPATASIPKNSEVYFQLVLWSISLFASNSILPLIVLLTIPHSVLGFITTLASLCEIVGTDRILIIALRAVFRYVTVFEHIWTMIASMVMCCLGEELPIALRLFSTILSLCWGGFGLLTFYFEQYEQDGQQAGQHAAYRRAPVTRSRTPSRSPARRYR